MADGTFLNIKRPITVRAVVTPTWKEEAERELSNGIATADQQLAQLEQEGQDVVDVGSSRVDLQACKLEYSIVSPK